MSSSAFVGESPQGSSYVDWTDLSGLDRVVAAYTVSDSAVVVRTSDGRELRITAWRNLSTGQYVADFERRSTVKTAGHEFHVWSQTPAYQRCTGEDVQSCLESAVLEVDRVHVY
jgi:hypothetical protein